MSLKVFLTPLLWFFLCYPALGQHGEHPRIYIKDQSRSDFIKSIETVSWKKAFVEEKKERLAKYIELWEEDPEWLVSRLQMNWNTKHNKVFLNEGDFSHSEGTAPVPTVRFSGSRDWATDYKSPKLEDIIPYSDDPKGIYLERKDNQKKEWVAPSETGNIIEKINDRILELVSDAAFLYWVTGEKKYADFASPVFFTYIDGMYHREAPIDIENSGQQRISGLATFEVIHERIVVSLVTSYDFLHDYFKDKNKNLDNTITVFQRWGDQIIVNGIPDNNWNLFQARFLTYIALVLDDNSSYKNKKGREYFLKHTFDVSTERQLALKESLLVYDAENGIWPESASYSVHVITTLLRIITLLDNATNTNELATYPIVEKAVFAAFQYLFPSGYIVGFGDSKHSILPPENFELLLANYKKYGTSEKGKIISTLLNELISNGQYTREASNYFELFFYVDALEKDSLSNQGETLEKLTSPTFYAPNVSLFNQRMGSDDNSVMVSTFGSFGNHAHANGIAIELFANNYVLGPDMGRGPSYWHPHHREYFSRFPAHNTVIVDGISDYYAMRSYHPFKLDYSFPKSEENATFDKVTFSKVSFLEPKTISKQQRFTAIVKSPTEKPYVVDVFRSKRQQEGKQKHEYFYHNLGQSLTFKSSKGKEFALSLTDQLSSKLGDAKGYDYFKDKKKFVTSDDIQAFFRITEKNQPDNLMKVWIKGDEKQQIYSVNGPPSKAITSGTAPKELINEPLPAFIIKREKAAWENPFALVFNPYIEGNENPISNVAFSTIEKYPTTQLIEVELKDKKTVDHITLNASVSDIAERKYFYQKGLVSIIRKLKESNEIRFLFLSGMEKFEYHDWSIITSVEAATVSIELTEEGYQIENDKPVTIGIPIGKDRKMAELQLFEDGKLVSSRKAVVSRSNPNKMKIKLSKAYSNAKLLLKE
ncbi:heparinase II/III domain-containing protein [Flagellimonas eckloniae]|uniref:heparinase II/III domain-containing protein n=1 Tax=Flagellimonas eckloniae TaxID=346185 RepID=UPI0009E9BA9F|nr:heparinase II/III family protein [Allomuricauda eckloniae]